MPSEGKIIVEGVAMATKHKKPRGMGQQGGIIDQEAPIYRVRRLCWFAPSCGKPTRARTQAAWMTATKARLCKKCGETF